MLLLIQSSHAIGYLRIRWQTPCWEMPMSLTLVRMNAFVWALIYSGGVLRVVPVLSRCLGGCVAPAARRMSRRRMVLKRPGAFWLGAARQILGED